MTEGIKLGVGEMITGAARVFRDHPLPIALYVFTVAAIGVVNDRFLPQGLTLLDSLVGFFAGYLLYRRILRDEELMAPGRTGYSFGSYFGVSFLAGLGIVLGLLLFIVPGLILAARWAIASPLVVARGMTASEAMRESWELTRISQWRIALLYLLYGFCLVALMVAVAVPAGLFTGEMAEENLGITVALNLLTQCFAVGGVALGVAIMRALGADSSRLETIFA